MRASTGTTVGPGRAAAAVLLDAERARPRWRRGAIAALVFVALAWGVAFSVVKEALDTVSPAGLVSGRFAIAALVLLLLRPRTLTGIRLGTALRAVVLGVLLGTGFLLHTWGMQTTSVVVSAFITGSVVVFAPLVARVWLHRTLGLRSLTAIALATLGLAVITVRGASFGRGDVLIGIAALLWAVHLVALEQWTRPGDVYQTALIQLAVVAALGATVETATTGHLAIPAAAATLLALLLLGAVATAAAFVALTWAQTRTDATTAAVVLTLEPVFGAGTAVMLGETLSLPVGLGAVAVIAGAFVITQPTRTADTG